MGHPEVLRAHVASWEVAELDAQSGHVAWTWEREETCVLVGLGGFALIRRLRKPTPFTPASPSFKAEVSGRDGCLMTRRESKKKKNNTQKETPRHS